MLSVSEVASLFRVSSTTIYTWVRRGILVADFITPTNRRYFSEEQVQKLMRGDVIIESKDS